MSLHDRFARQARRTPDAVAIVDRGHEVTYAELSRRAAAVSDQLSDHGIPRGSLIALSMPRGTEAVAALIGILGHGCAYVPVDPAHPESRRRFIIADSGAAAVVATGPTVQMLPSASRRDLPADTAYVIYTSGSTGQPKGVVVGHKHVLSLLEAALGELAVDDTDVWTLFHSLSFDFSVWELWAPLLAGAQVVLVPGSVAADPRGFADLLATEQVTVLNQVPTVFGHLVTDLTTRPLPLPDLRYVVFGGEALDLEAVRRWRATRLAPAARLVNMYGITETTVHVTSCPISDDPASPVTGATPIGTALPHLSVEVVDDDLVPVPAGVPGELLVGGASVSYGYLGRPELTAQRFVGHGTARAYRTGDLAVRDADGGLHYIGRKDRQVQLRGYRIEPGEIEAVIAEHPDVERAAVVVSANAGREPVLVAHYVPVRGADPGRDALAAHVADRLPAHLRPSAFRSHDRFPATGNGKVDLDSLTELY